MQIAFPSSFVGRTTNTYLADLADWQFLIDVASSKMTVQEASDVRQDTVGERSENPLGHAPCYEPSKIGWRRPWIAKIHESGACAAPPILESQEPFITPIRAPHFEFSKADFLGFLNGPPN